MTQIFLPCGSFDKPEYDPRLHELLFVEYDSMSVREKARIDHAMEFGELYVAEYTTLATGTQVFKTDLGTSNESSRVEIHVPSYVPKESAIYWLADLVNKITNSGDF